jgi:hypothetical protein
MQNGRAENALAFALIQSGLATAAPQPATEPTPVCQYCNSTAELVTGEDIYPHLEYLHHKHFWRCVPCRAYVGCHDAGNGYGEGTRPLGVLANAELRAAKKAVHDLFDPLWKSGGKGRKKAYRWLAGQMGMPADDCHVGAFSVEQCRQARAILIDYQAHSTPLPSVP